MGGHELLNENLCARHRLSPYVLLVREAPEIPKERQAVTIAFGCPSQLDGETLLLKTLFI